MTTNTATDIGAFVPNPGRRGLLRLMGLACAVALPLAAAPALAYDGFDPNSKKAVNVDFAGLALRGYDPVGYFTLGKPTPGLASIVASHEGARYQFATAAHRDAFLAQPAKYAPAFGGFCAMGAVMEKKLDGDPTLWRIVDGKLYLNVAAPAQKRWLEDVPGNITKATANWSRISNEAPSSL